MMWRLPEARFDGACAISKGARARQEDAVVCDFPVGGDSGFSIVADGMGGHSGGDVASRHVITQLYTALKFSAEQYSEYSDALPEILGNGLEAANASIRDHVRQHPRLQGMGSTVICLALVEARAHWLSVGDSPLYLLRGGVLKQLNQNHSYAHDLSLMVKSGAMEAEDAKFHPDRNLLTSAIAGGPIAQTDCPDTAFDLKVGDILVLASDGLQFLSEAQIGRVLTKNRRRSAAEICGQLMAAIDALNDTDQDNVSVSVIKVNHVRPNIERAQIATPTFRSRRQRATVTEPLSPHVSRL